MSQRPVVMLLIPGRDALCLELSPLWLGVLFVGLALPFASALTARAYLASPAARHSLSAATASLSRAIADPAPLAQIEDDHEGLSATSDPEPPELTLTSAVRRAGRAMTIAATEPQLPTRDAEPHRHDATAVETRGHGAQQSGKVIDARDVKRAFALRRDVLGVDAEHAVQLARGSLHMQAVRFGETIHTRPFDDAGRALAEPFAALRHLMRCRVTGEEVAIDPKLVRLLTQISAAYERPLQLISGHRTPHTLGTSPRSQHALGRAADIRIRGVSLPALRQLAIQLGARGVGLYPEKGFVHVDVRDKPRYFWDYTAARGEEQYRPGM